MRRRSILLVSYHFLPAATPGSRRLDTVARLLAERGWESIVLTATGGRDGEDRPSQVEVIRTTPSRLRGEQGGPAIARPRLSRIPLLRHAAGFPDKYAPWGAALTPRLLDILRSRPIDVVFSSSPPHSTHVAVSMARALRSFRWVAEFRDPWMFPSRRAVSPLSASVQRRMERHVLARADRVIANTPGNRDALLSANPGIDGSHVHVSTNGYDASLFAPGSFPQPPGETADITYVGEVYAGMLDRYAAAIASIRARDPARVPRLAVYGTIDASEKRRISALELDPFIENRGFVSHEESIAAMKNARALLVLLPPGERWRTCVPSKLYWYLAACRPILAIVPDGDAAALVRALNRGLALVDPDTHRLGQRLEAWVIETRQSPPAQLSGEGTGRYAMDTIVDELDRVLRGVTDGHSA